MNKEEFVKKIVEIVNKEGTKFFIIDSITAIQEEIMKGANKVAK